MAFDGERALALLKEISFPRVGGSAEEERAASIIADRLREIGLDSQIEEFPIWTYAKAAARVEVVAPYRAEVEASAVGLSGNTPPDGLVAPLKYVETGSPEFLRDIQGRILLLSGSMGAKSYEKAKAKGALGAIRIGSPERDLPNVSTSPHLFTKFGKLPSAYISYTDALDMLKRGAQEVKMTVIQEESEKDSRNVIAEIPGTEDRDEIILVGAHFDSVPLTQGAHDNAAGSATIFEMARYFKEYPARRTIRFVWFGSEELGLHGGFAYALRHKDELAKHKLMVNVDVAGGIIGQNSASVMASDKLVSYLEFMGKELGVGLNARSSIYSGDCIPLGDKGVPAVTFARGGGGTFYLHTPGDRLEHVDAAHLAMLGGFCTQFVQRMADSADFPVDREIPAPIKKSIKDYLENMRGKSDRDDGEKNEDKNRDKDKEKEKDKDKNKDKSADQDI